jgi:acetyltransferase-like isoleucine patch superfamily enzyme
MSIKSRFNSFLRKRRLKKIHNGFSASIRSTVRSNVIVSDFVSLKGKTSIRHSQVGAYTYFADCMISNTSIGSFCSIGPGVIIGGLGRHPVNMISTHPAFYSLLMQAGTTFSDDNYFEELKQTKVGHDVWVGANVTVLDGVVIGNGAIVAAGSVIVKEVPPYAIVGGVPGKLIRFRFSQSEVELLEATGWWHFPPELLIKLAPDFRMGDVLALCEKIKKLKN